MGKATDKCCGTVALKKCDNTPLLSTDLVATCADVGVFATPAETIAGANPLLKVNPPDLYARENIAAQTGLSNNLTLIAAPTASQSPWGTNLLGETLHYMPGVGWKIVADFYVAKSIATPAVLGAAALHTVASFVAPRAGTLTVIGDYVGDYPTSANDSAVQSYIRVNGGAFQQVVYTGPAGLSKIVNALIVAQGIVVAAGDVVQILAVTDPSSLQNFNIQASAFRISSIRYTS